MDGRVRKGLGDRDGEIRSLLLAQMGSPHTPQDLLHSWSNGRSTARHHDVDGSGRRRHSTLLGLPALSRGGPARGSHGTGEDSIRSDRRLHARERDMARRASRRIQDFDQPAGPRVSGSLWASMVLEFGTWSAFACVPQPLGRPSVADTAGCGAESSQACPSSIARGRRHEIDRHQRHAQVQQLLAQAETKHVVLGETRDRKAGSDSGLVTRSAFKAARPWVNPRGGGFDSHPLPPIWAAKSLICKRWPSSWTPHCE
jgi:hypothetical protein